MNHEDRNKPLLEHLIELRNRLLRMLLCISLVFIVFLPFANQLYSLMATPLINLLPEGSTMIATEITSPFFAPFKLSFFVALCVSMPYLLYQAWLFVAPALYQNERVIAMPIIASSIILFYVGIAFAFFLVLPVLFKFFISVTPGGINIMTDINHYLNFMLKILFAFGIAFEIPVATYLAITGGFIEVERLAEKRPYVILLAFVIGMLITPPDAISQILLAVPTWLLFELGLYIGRLSQKKQGDKNVD